MENFRNRIKVEFIKKVDSNKTLKQQSKNLKFNNNDTEKIIEKFHDSRENLLYMLSFEKLIRDEQETDNSHTFHFKEMELNKW